MAYKENPREARQINIHEGLLSQKEEDCGIGRALEIQKSERVSDGSKYLAGREAHIFEYGPRELEDKFPDSLCFIKIDGRNGRTDGDWVQRGFSRHCDASRWAKNRGMIVCHWYGI